MKEENLTVTGGGNAPRKAPGGALTVKELIDQLMALEPDMPVFFSYNYGDHCRTTAAEPVRHADVIEVVEWPYGNCYKVVDRYDEEESERDIEEATGAVVLR